MFEKQYIKVILPQALPQLYTYEVPQEFHREIKVGKRVEVQFGKRKIYAAIIHSYCEKPEQVAFIKPILSVLDDDPIIQEWQLSFWEWMANYYMCTMGDVMNAALPSAFKLSSESAFLKNPLADDFEKDLADDEFMVMEAFNFQEELSFQEIQQITSKTSIIKLIKGLMSKELIYIKEALKEKYKPKTKAFVVLNKDYDDQAALKVLFDDLARADKQLAILLTFLDLKQKGETEISKAKLLELANASDASLKGLVKKEVFEIEYREVDRLEDLETDLQTNILNDQQHKALVDIKEYFKTKQTVLLHGITSSGKTHVYVELIKEAVAKGKQVLFLLPEIALTAQLIQRLRRWLGDVGIYHSKFNDAERIEIWNKVQQGQYKIVVGARSALFLPFQSLGLVVADEEHDTSYKQYDPAPRYQARDSAIYLAHLHKSKSIVGISNTFFLKPIYNALKRSLV
ncbi:MAG: DEAD/DEAH box helicase family protein [Chitinophagales bacterium]